MQENSIQIGTKTQNYMNLLLANARQSNYVNVTKKRVEEEEVKQQSVRSSRQNRNEKRSQTKKLSTFFQPVPNKVNY